MDKEYITALVGLGGVVVGGILTTVKDVLAERRALERDRGHLAVVASLALARFAEQCDAVLHDNGTFEGEPSSAKGFAPVEEDPKFSVAGMSVNWKAIEPRLLYKLLDLEDQLAKALNTVSYALREDSSVDGHESIEYRQRVFGKLGLNVLALLKDLHDVAGLPDGARSNLVESMNAHLDHLRNRDRQRHEREEALQRELSRGR